MNAAFSSQIAEQAVHWLIESQSDDFDQHQALERWLQADSEHQRAWAHIQQVNQRLRGVTAPVVHATLQAPPSPARRRALKALLLVGVASAAGLGLQQHNPLPGLTADYRSPVGQRRRLTLDDGSQLHLNTRSAADVRFDGRQRLVRLQEGELLLEVSNDPRPLRLATAQGELHLHSGRFDVRQFDGFSLVSVFSGSASVAGTPLLAGHQARFARGGWQAVAPLDPNRAAWVEGMLVVSQMRLGDFLAELSRYRLGQLGCSERVADLRISGSYPLADSERILEMLEVTLPVKVRRFTRYWVSLEAASTG
ncbi:membrane protein [Pseudomonas sp. 250J]|uniref:FecR family protein n=1 Tax=Pseudomonas peradeniyensis TaxID=2745488 RepID=A0ABT2VDQ2_9PSED|nr:MULTISPECIES: FecR family protein [unclassified Pseudomonas]KNX76548.1 membrane protein [Pseudomonas sp. 250J]MCU7239854.1 FecR family protein [Pseudomonas peradeniyensis]MCU7279388.1 FecR family protein [Pseudomonas peradeniyensis]QZA55264.1 FecR family protein [Pseudomonas sp. 2hn]